jgi:hypothetical protein
VVANLQEKIALLESENKARKLEIEMLLKAQKQLLDKLEHKEA